MSHFFTENMPQDNLLIIEGSEANHIVNARRAQVGDCIHLFDKNARCYRAQIISLAKKKVCLQILESYVHDSVFPIDFHLVQALVKSKKWDLILQTAMELGLQNLTPLLSEHVAAGANTAGRKERWSKVMLAAAKQSERPHLITIHETQTFSQIIAQQERPILLAHTDPELPTMHETLKQLSIPKSLTVLVGPEGGFSDNEIKQAKQCQHVHFFSLGKQILRAETAAAAIIANILFYFS